MIEPDNPCEHTSYLLIGQIFPYTACPADAEGTECALPIASSEEAPSGHFGQLVLWLGGQSIQVVRRVVMNVGGRDADVDPAGRYSPSMSRPPGTTAPTAGQRHMTSSVHVKRKRHEKVLDVTGLAIGLLGAYESVRG